MKIYLAIFIVAPFPRISLKPEKTYRTVDGTGETSSARSLPCWQDAFQARKKAVAGGGNELEVDSEVEAAEVFMSLVVPAYNEQDRIGIMLTEAVEYLQQEYGKGNSEPRANGVSHGERAGKPTADGYARQDSSKNPTGSENLSGWEILIVSDGSTDKTVETALQFARDLGSELSSSIRVISLQLNRGKGGAVTHGMRHIRGQYAIFADADGASRFEDLGKLLQACRECQDSQGRAVAVGSRAHLVGSEAVVKVRSN